MGHCIISLSSNMCVCVYVLGRVFPGIMCSLPVLGPPRASWGSALLGSLSGALAGTVWKIYSDPVLPLAVLL